MPYGLMNRIPYTLPENKLPAGTRCIQITIPDDDEWENQLNSLIRAEFCRWLMWERDIGKNGTKVASRWRVALKTWKHCDGSPVPMGTLVDVESLMSELVQVICDSNGKCVLQYRCDTCSDWITVANLTDLQTNPSGDGNQPAPGGGVATYCKTVYANSSIILPVPVNAGDKIEVTLANGSWSGTPFQWRCIDGNIFFVTCTSSPGSISGSNPVPSAQTMSLIVQFSTGYYALYPGGSLIVPGGVVNEQPTLLANKPTLTSGAGQIDVCLKVTNNKTAAWTHHFDFTLNDGGWIPETALCSDPAVWTPGIGWTGVYGGGTCAPTTMWLAFRKNFSATITSIRAIYSMDVAGSGDLDDGTISLGTIGGAPGSYDQTFPGTHVITGHIRFVLSASGTSATWICSDIYISGTGTDPF